MWLYDMAEYRDSVIEEKRLEELYKKEPKTKPAQGKTEAGKKPAKAKQVEEYEVDEEESTFGNAYKPQKKKPANIAALSKPVFGGKQMTEEQKKEQ